jgi:hypothetical protein
MSNFYVSGSTPSAPVTHVKLFISYALGHVTTATVKDVFDTVFDNEVEQIEELTKQDRVTGKPFKLFWITLNPARHSRVWRFVDEIEQFGSARIIYESKRGNDYYWQVRINKDKEQTPAVKTTPRILPREVTTSETATPQERADVIAFSKTPEFSKLVDSVVFAGVIEPKLEEGEIKEKSKIVIKGNSAERRKAERAALQKRSEAMAANDASMEAKAKVRQRAAAAGMTVEKYTWLLEDEKRERAALQEETSYGKRQRLEAQEEALTEWEQREEREHDAFIFDDASALAM